MGNFAKVSKLYCRTILYTKQRPSETYSDGLCIQVALQPAFIRSIDERDCLEFYEAYFFTFLAAFFAGAALAGAALAAGSDAAASGATASGAATGSEAAGSEAADSAVR